MTHEVVGSCQGETRMPEHVGISPAEEGWTVANDNETCLVVALNCYVLQHGGYLNRRDRGLSAASIVENRWAGLAGTW
jgi:hypothetical protein